MKKIIKFAVVFIALAVITCLTPLNIYAACADEQELFTEGSSYMPNVLIILDNSQSMDEDFVGNLVGPWATGSRLVEAKRALQLIASKYANTMRIGLMTYKLSNNVYDYDVHNAVYFASYEPKSYCPSTDKTVLDACQDYCKTGNATSQDTCQGTAGVSGCRALNSVFDATYRDEIITNYAVNSATRAKYCNLIYPKTNRYPNPTDTTNYIYYKIPGTFYAGSNQGNKFCYSENYNASEGGTDNYRIYPTKTGTSDGSYQNPNPGQYSGSYGSQSFYPTDEDTALGFNDFGRRMAWYYVGRTWFANTSPGGGHLHVPADTNIASNTQLNKLLAKLDMKENNETGYMSCSSSNTCSYIVNAGLTPIAGTLQTAIDYFKGNSSPIQDSCQKNFVIFVTDGLPSVNTKGSKDTAASLMPDVLTKIDKLRAVQKTLASHTYTFNIMTFVVGMALTADAKPYLDNMAVHGGTATDGQALYADNATDIYNTLDTAMSSIISRSYSFSTASISASRTADENYLYEATFEPGSVSPLWKGYLKKWSLTSDGSMNQVVWEAGAQLQSASAANRNIKTLIGGNLVNFKSSDIDASTPVPYTYMQYAADTTSTVVVTNQATANKVIKYIRGYATDPADGTALNPDNWKLGDVFHSSPITLGTPSLFYSDTIDANNAFAAYRSAHPRASSDGTRMVIAGANDGQFHAFRTSTGAEFWSFIPPNLLPKLQDLYHTSNPSTLPHNFYVDGSIMATDAWLPASWSNGGLKASGDWKTLVMFSLGRNDCDYSTTNKSAVRQSTKYWSSSASCDTGIQEATDGSHLNYCGYYAFDFTNAPGSDPLFKWTLQPGATLAPYLGEPWSNISPGRVRIGGNEVWIGVIGGGYNAALASTDLRGKGIIVFDLRNGTPIWSFTHADNGDMDYSIASQVTLLDMDNDGFVDRAYVGDIKGNMWQLKFCAKTDLQSNANCGTSSWRGSLLLAKDTGSDKFPVYYPPGAVWDRNGVFWLYWATGDKVDPNGSGPAAWVYGLKALLCTNTDGTPTPCARNFSNITSQQNSYCTDQQTSSTVGWAINLAGQGEQVLDKTTAFNNILYFTSFTPATGSSASCTKTGESSLYALSIDPGTSAADCTAGSGVIDASGARSEVIGVGIASGGTISYGPGGGVNIFYTVSGAGGQEGGTLRSDFIPPSPATRANLLYWKDRRLQ
ncbi:MAG: PilC/PilY family type IV pilus protein [Smithella sp.]